MRDLVRQACVDASAQVLGDVVLASLVRLRRKQRDARRRDSEAVLGDLDDVEFRRGHRPQDPGVEVHQSCRQLREVLDDVLARHRVGEHAHGESVDRLFARDVLAPENGDEMRSVIALRLDDDAVAFFLEQCFLARDHRAPRLFRLHLDRVGKLLPTPTQGGGKPLAGVEDEVVVGVAVVHVQKHVAERVDANRDIRIDDRRLGDLDEQLVVAVRERQHLPGAGGDGSHLKSVLRRAPRGRVGVAIVEQRQGQDARPRAVHAKRQVARDRAVLVVGGLQREIRPRQGRPGVSVARPTGNRQRAQRLREANVVIAELAEVEETLPAADDLVVDIADPFEPAVELDVDEPALAVQSRDGGAKIELGVTAQCAAQQVGEPGPGRRGLDGFAAGGLVPDLGEHRLGEQDEHLREAIRHAVVRGAERFRHALEVGGEARLVLGTRHRIAVATAAGEVEAEDLPRPSDHRCRRALVDRDLEVAELCRLLLDLPSGCRKREGLAIVEDRVETGGGGGGFLRDGGGDCRSREDPCERKETEAAASRHGRVPSRVRGD